MGAGCARLLPGGLLPLHEDPLLPRGRSPLLGAPALSSRGEQLQRPLEGACLFHGFVREGAARPALTLAGSLSALTPAAWAGLRWRARQGTKSQGSTARRASRRGRKGSAPATVTLTERRRQSGKNGAKGQRTSGATASATIELGGAAAGPLAVAGKEKEKAVWAHAGVTRVLSRILNEVLQEQNKAWSADSSWLDKQFRELFRVVTWQYSELVTQSQMDMLSATLVKHDLDYMPTDLTGESLEEPLSWRPLVNSLGLNAFSLDLFCWRTITEFPESGRSSSSKGFAASPGIVGGGPLQALDDQDIKYRWLLVCTVAAQFTGGAPVLRCAARIVMPSRMSAQLRELGLGSMQGAGASNLIDICTFSGAFPPLSLLTSTEHSIVIVVPQEPGLVPDESSWALSVPPDEDDHGSIYYYSEAGAERLRQTFGEVDMQDDESDCAPVVVLNLMQHAAAVKKETFIKRALAAIVFRETSIGTLPKEEGQKEDIGLPSFLQNFVSAVQGSVDIFGQDETTLKVACDLLRQEVAPMIRKGYSAAWVALREERIRGLNRAKAAWEAKTRREQARQEQEKAARAGLEEALRALDVELFEERAKTARRKKSISDGDFNILSGEMYQDLALAEGPFRRLVEEQVAGDEAVSGPALDPMIEELKMLLKTTRLPARSTWPRVSGDLLEALLALKEAHEKVSAMTVHEHSSMVSSRAALKDCNVKVLRGEAAVLQFEAGLRMAGEQLGTQGAENLRCMLADVKGKHKEAKVDQDLWECLEGPPWDRAPLDVLAITPWDAANLEAKVSAASGPLFSRLQERLEAALVGGRCAQKLRKALDAGDAEALNQSLQEAKQHSLAGLELATTRLQELNEKEAELSEIRLLASEAVVDLDGERLERLLSEACSRGSALPEEAELRSQLACAVREAETNLQKVLIATDGEDKGNATTVRSLQEAFEASKLRRSSSWFEVVTASCDALEASAGIRKATAATTAAVDMAFEDGEPAEAKLRALEEALDSGERAMEHLRESTQALELLEHRRLVAWVQLDEALEMAQFIFWASTADEALRLGLAAAPWGTGRFSFPEVQSRDVADLEALAEEATAEGRERVGLQLEVALAAGKCAVALHEGFMDASVAELEEKLSQAKALGFCDLDQVEVRLDELKDLAKRQAERHQKGQMNSKLNGEAAPEEAAAAATAKVAEESGGVPAPPPKPGRSVPPVAAPVGVGWADENWGSVVALSSNLIFLDLELTAGFYDFDIRPRVLEAAIVVTDKDLKEKGRGSWVIGEFSREELEALGDFHQAHFRDTETGGSFPPHSEFAGLGNGLFSDVLASHLTLEEAQCAMLELVKKHCPPGACPLTGYSVQCDREVLKVEMPRLYRYVSHQIVDISGFLRMARLQQPEKVKRWGEARKLQYNHRALNDVEDSIATLRWVQEQFFKSPEEQFFKFTV